MMICLYVLTINSRTKRITRLILMGMAQVKTNPERDQEK